MENTNSNSGRGRLRWNPVSQLQAARYQENGAPSPVPQGPEFLGDLPKPWETYTPKHRITQELQHLIEVSSYSGAFQSAIDRVRKQFIPEMHLIHTLYQFYAYIDIMVEWRPGLRVWEWQGGIYHERTDYLRITQFYYYFNQPELVALQSPIDPVAGQVLTPLSLWLRDFAVAWGEFLDTEESSKYLASYMYGPEYTYWDFGKPGEGGNIQQYRTFNEWFSRTFQNIEVQRPVASPDDPRVIAFPAESTFVGQWTVTTSVQEPMNLPSAIVVKHVEWPIQTLLKDSEYADEFEGGILVHSFLNVFDYHRQHAPVDGKVLEAKFISGQVYLDVTLEKLNAEERGEENSALANVVTPLRYLDAQDSTGYQFVQNRGLFVMETAIGKVAVLPMGMAQVSSVVFVKPGTDELIRLTPEQRRGKSYDEQVALLNEMVAREWVGKSVKKGEMISSFLFGGSDIVVVFSREANVNILAQVNVHYPIRSQYAYSNITKLKNY